MNGTTRPVGELLREWRQRRRMSQMDLALEADISTGISASWRPGDRRRAAR